MDQVLDIGFEQPMLRIAVNVWLIAVVIVLVWLWGLWRHRKVG